MNMNLVPDPTWQYQYVMTTPRPAEATRPFFGAVPVGSGAAVDAYNDVSIPAPTRTLRLKSEQHVSTELYGTAPFLGRGDGVIMHVDVSNRMREGDAPLRGDKASYDGAPLNRWDFVGAPLAVQPVAEQHGQQARLAGVYE